jgi:hypothetical protein
VHGHVEANVHVHVVLSLLEQESVPITAELAIVFRVSPSLGSVDLIEHLLGTSIPWLENLNP